MSDDPRVDYLSAAAVLTGAAPTNHPAPQVGRRLATCTACERPCAPRHELCTWCSTIDVVALRWLHDLDLAVVVWCWQQSGFTMTTLVSAWFDGDQWRCDSEELPADVEAQIAEFIAAKKAG